MSTYLDASILVAAFTTDALASRAETFLRSCATPLVVSDFTAAEFAAAIARKTRTGQIRNDAAWRGFTDFDTWVASAAARAILHTSDIAAAGSFIRRLDMPLRTPDALNIAIAQRIGATLATCDTRMAACARTLGLNVAPA